MDKKTGLKWNCCWGSNTLYLQSVSHYFSVQFFFLIPKTVAHPERQMDILDKLQQLEASIKMLELTEHCSEVLNISEVGLFKRRFFIVKGNYSPKKV